MAENKAGTMIHMSRTSGRRTAQNQAANDQMTQPEVSMESMQTSMGMSKGAPAHDGGMVTTEES